MYELLKALTVEELKAKCRKLSLRGYSKLNEDGLINKIIDSGKFEIEDKVIINDEDKTTIRTFKRLIPNPLTIGEIRVTKDQDTFTIKDSEISSLTLKKLNHSIGRIIEEI